MHQGLSAARSRDIERAREDEEDGFGYLRMLDYCSGVLGSLQPLGRQIGKQSRSHWSRRKLGPPGLDKTWGSSSSLRPVLRYVLCEEGCHGGSDCGRNDLR